MRKCCREMIDQANLVDLNLSYVDFYNAHLNQAALLFSDLRYSNLRAANLNETDMYSTNLSYANLSSAYMKNVDLRNSNLKGTNLNRSFLIAVDMRNTENLLPEQLITDDPPLLCNVALPTHIMSSGISPYRDCDQLPQVMQSRTINTTLEEAQRIVNEARQKQWGEPTDTPTE